jgi:hypothetical protein
MRQWPAARLPKWDHITHDISSQGSSKHSTSLKHFASELTRLVVSGINQLRVSGAAGEAVFFGGELEGLFAVELGLVHEFFDAGSKGLRGVGVRTRFCSIGSADEQGDFTAGGAFFEGCGDFRKLSTEKLLVELSDLASKACRTVAENLARVRNGFSDAVRSFVEDKGAVLDTKPFESAAALAATRGEKSDEQKFLVG